MMDFYSCSRIPSFLVIKFDIVKFSEIPAYNMKKQLSTSSLFLNKALLKQ